MDVCAGLAELIGQHASLGSGELERLLDQSVVVLERFLAEHPHADVDEPVAAIEKVVGLIVAGVPLCTLGDVRFQAKALLIAYDGKNIGDGPNVRPLLEALAALPERLCDEPIVPV